MKFKRLLARQYLFTRVHCLNLKGPVRELKLFQLFNEIRVKALSFEFLSFVSFSSGEFQSGIAVRILDTGEDGCYWNLFSDTFPCQFRIKWGFELRFGKKSARRFCHLNYCVRDLIP